jgi:soluble lytic murein transglycosylase
MRAEAAAELDALIADADNPAFLVQLADTLTTRSLWSSAARAANRAAGLLPAKTLAGAPLAVRRLAFPAAYSDLVCAQSAKYGVDPLLLLSLIRQESIYDPLAISVSDARGLTQVIPATGRGIAANLNRQGFAPADLFRPAVSVEFGAAYLAENLKRFGGDAFKAAAAYNAGPGPVPRWATSDPDLFVERIDYSQTRNYVRGVYTHHSMYRSLERELSCAGQ